MPRMHINIMHIKTKYCTETKTHYSPLGCFMLTTVGLCRSNGRQLSGKHTLNSIYSCSVFAKAGQKLAHTMPVMYNTL